VLWYRVAKFLTERVEILQSSIKSLLPQTSSTSEIIQLLAVESRGLRQHSLVGLISFVTPVDNDFFPRLDFVFQAFAKDCNAMLHSPVRAADPDALRFEN
jgi:hypothetical protein